MIILILLSCFPAIVSSAPASPNVHSSVISQGEANRATSQTPGPLAPQLQQPGVSQQPDSQNAFHFLPPTQNYNLAPPAGSPMFIPLQQPVILPPHTYFPLLSSHQMNRLFSPPHGFLRVVAANQLPKSPTLNAGTLSGAAPVGSTLQTILQQQNPQLVYMLQQPMNLALGSLSSEELEMAAEIGQAYLPALLTDPSAGAVQPIHQAAGLKNSQGVTPTAGSAGAPMMQDLASSGPQPETNGVPAGLEKPTQQVATIQPPAEAKLQPTQTSHV